jgi:hypothetical protein
MSTVTLAGSFSGTSYDTTVDAPPSIAISGSMQTVIIYGSSNSTKNFIQGKVFNFVSNSSVDLSFPAWMTDTKSVFDVTDTYLYARNIENKAGTTTKFHGGYYIYGNQLSEYFKPIVLITPEIDNWVRSLLYENPSNHLNVVRQHVVSNVVTLVDEVHDIDGEFLTWDKKQTVATAVVTGAGTSLNRIQGRGNWFFVSKPDTMLKNFDSISLHPHTGAEIVVSAQTDQNHVLKVYSKNMKCALIYDGTDFKTFDFGAVSSGTVSDIKTIPSGLYTGVTIDGTTIFEVSDNCGGVRINSILMHYWTGGPDYYVDTFPLV